MRTFRDIVLGLLGASAVASASDVHDLKKDNFDDFIKSHDLVLAEFFAPWCGHCKALAPEYESAATELKPKNIPLVKVDCTAEADLCQAHGVSGYPTVKVFRGPDNVSPYGGARKADAIVSYMTKAALPAVSELESDKLEEFKKSDKVVLVAYLAEDDKKNAEAYTETANGLRENYLFGSIKDADVAKAEGIRQPSLVLYKSFDEGKVVYDGKFEKEAITDFAKKAATPLVGEVGPDTYQGYMDAGLPLAYIFSTTAEERKELADTLKPIAEKHKGKVNFATIDASSFGAHAGNLNLEVDKWPAFAIQDVAKNQKFPFDQTKKLTEKDIGAFVNDYVSGKVQPSIKSEPVPEKQDGPVAVVVAHNYDEIVKDDKKDVLLEFYAPWCGHCKALAPKYEELGALYADNKDYASKVTIAKINAVENDSPEDVQGFPTIKLFPAGAKDKPIEYQGDRTIEDLAKFVKENGKHGVDAYAKKDEAEDKAMPDADSMGKAAEAATEKVKEAVKSVASEATEAVKSAAPGGEEPHDEL